MDTEYNSSDEELVDVEENQTVSLLFEILACQSWSDQSEDRENKKENLISSIKTTSEALFGPGDWGQDVEESAESFVHDSTRTLLLIGKTNENIFHTANSIEDIVCSGGKLIAYFLKKPPVHQMKANSSPDLDLLSGTIDLENFEEDFRSKVRQYESELLDKGSHIKDFAQHLLLHSMDFRGKLLGNKDLLISAENWGIGTKRLSEDEFVVERIEKAVLQWIDVIDVSIQFKQKVVDTDPGYLLLETFDEEVTFWLKRHEQLSRTLSQMDRKECKKMKTILKLADSVMLDELTIMELNLNDEAQQTQLTLKFLKVLLKPLEKLKTCELTEIPPTYDEIIDLVFVVSKHAPAYSKYRSEAVNKLVSLVGREIVVKCCAKVKGSLDSFFNGRAQETMQNSRTIAECIQTCSAILKDAVCLHCSYTREVQWDINPDVAQANLIALEIRLKHLRNISHCMELFGRFDEGVPSSLDCNIGDIMKKSHERFYNRLLPSVTEHKDAILDVYNLQWNEIYKQFRLEVDEIEMELVNTFERAVEKNLTIWAKADVLKFFRMFYEQSLFSAAMDSSANSIFKLASQEAKSVCKMNRNIWTTPVNALLHTSVSNRCMIAQRARGYIDKIAKLIHELHWVGSSEHQNKALTRCKQTRQLLGDFIYKEFSAWVSSLENCYELTSGAIFQKIILMRHFQRPEWIQPNMDKVLFPALETAECWDRLLLEIPQVFQPVWQERHELRACYELVSTLVYIHNSVTASLTPTQREEHREILAKLNLALEPGLYGIPWSQGSMIKKFISNCTAILEELVRELQTVS